MFFLLSLLSSFALEPSSGELEQGTVTLFTSQPSTEQMETQERILERYQNKSTEIFIGTLIGSRPSRDRLGFHTLVDIEVERWIRGKGIPSSVSRKLPYRAPYIQGDPKTVSPIIIKGYRVLVFINKYGAIVDGNAIFVLVNGYAFRHKKPDIFFNPLYDRKWKESNPYDDYLMYDMAHVEQSIKDDGAFIMLREWFR
jgi:hypothetical protein